VLDGGVEVQVLELGLLAGDDDVYIVPTPEAVVGDRQERIGVGREVDPDDLGLLVDHEVDEAGILMAESVVILTPDVRGEEIAERCDRPPPRNVARDIEPFRVLVEHRADEVDEGLVAREQPVAPGEEVALEPALAQLLAQDFHHAAVGSEMDVAVTDRFHPGTVG